MPNQQQHQKSREKQDSTKALRLRVKSAQALIRSLERNAYVPPARRRCGGPGLRGAGGESPGQGMPEHVVRGLFEAKAADLGITPQQAQYGVFRRGVFKGLRRRVLNLAGQQVSCCTA
jgi:hypothetical protein